MKQFKIGFVDDFDMKKFVEDAHFLLQQKWKDVKHLPRKKKKAAKKRIFKEMSYYVRRELRKNFTKVTVL